MGGIRSLVSADAFFSPDGTPLTIDKEFSGICWKQTDNELSNLSISLSQEGCRDPVIYWDDKKDNPILDGQTRVRICQEKKIPYAVKGVLLGSRDEAICWIIRNQLCRRNITEVQRQHLLAEMARRITLQPTPPHSGYVAPCDIPLLGGTTEVDKIVDTSPKVPALQAASATAKAAGVHRSTVHRAIAADRKLDSLRSKAPGVAQEALAGVLRPADVGRLAMLQETQLSHLDGLAGKDLKRAVATLLHGAAPGNPVIPDHTKVLGELKSAIGNCIRLNTDAKKKLGEAKSEYHWEIVKAHFSNALLQIDEWILDMTPEGVEE